MKRETLIIIGLSVFLVSLIVFSVNTYLSKKSLEKSLKIVEDKTIELEKRNNVLIDSLDYTSGLRELEQEKYQSKLDSLNNLPKRPRYDKSIDDTNDPTYLDSLFAKHYGNNN